MTPAQAVVYFFVSQMLCGLLLAIPFGVGHNGEWGPRRAQVAVPDHPLVLTFAAARRDDGVRCRDAA